MPTPPIYWGYDNPYGRITLVAEDPPQHVTTPQAAWKAAIEDYRWLNHINTNDLGGFGGGVAYGSGGNQKKVVRLPYLTDFGWLSHLRRYGNANVGWGGYNVEVNGTYEQQSAGYAYLPWPEGIPELMDRLPAAFSHGYEQALQGLLVPPEERVAYGGVLPTGFQPRLTIPAPWEKGGRADRL